MGRSHAISGAVLGLAVCATVPTPPNRVPLIIALVCVGAFAPDLDHPNSTATRSVPPITWGLCWAVRNLSARLGLPAHRGLAHSPPFALAVGAALGLLGLALFGFPLYAAAWTGAAAALGCWIGAAGDELTTQGNRYLFWPVGQVRIPDWLRFRTGGRGERRVVLALYGVAVALLPAALA